jgi:hypothetical protein
MFFAYSLARAIVNNMKKLLFVGVMILSAAPVLAIAHTSDERYVDGYVVDLSTAPVAPWVNEKMGMSFVFLDPFTFRATTTVVQATIEIDATFRANGKPQEVIYAGPLLQVNDSGITTSHIFNEEGTYDIHLTFTDTSGKTHVAGYRKQVRDGAALTPHGAGPEVFFGTMFAIAVLAFIAGRLWNKKR